MKVQQIIKNKAYLAWDSAGFDSLSDESVLERVLNLGDWDDVQLFIKIQGIEKTKKLYASLALKNRNNLYPKIKAYFDRYFQK